jgi:hypothetical protein
VVIFHAELDKGLLRDIEVVDQVLEDAVVPELGEDPELDLAEALHDASLSVLFRMEAREEKKLGGMSMLEAEQEFLEATDALERSAKPGHGRTGTDTMRRNVGAADGSRWAATGDDLTAWWVRSSG